MKLQKEGKPTGDARVNKVYRAVLTECLRKILYRMTWLVSCDRRCDLM